MIKEMKEWIIENSPAMVSKSYSERHNYSSSTVASTTETKKNEDTKSNIEYSVEVASFCDVIIKKKTSAAESFLCLMPSQSQFYIKNKMGLTNLSKANLRGFFQGTNKSIQITGCNWLKEIPTNVNIDKFLKLTENVFFVELAKKNLIEVNLLSLNDFLSVSPAQDCDGGFNLKDMIQVLSRAAKKVPAGILRRSVSMLLFENDSPDNMKCSYNIDLLLGMLYQSMIENNDSNFFDPHIHLLNKSKYTPYSSFDYLKDIYGINGIYNIIDSLCSFYMPKRTTYYYGYRYGIPISSQLKLDSIHSLFFSEVLAKSRIFSLKEFTEYLTMNILKENLLDIWSDTLKLQETIYGKVKEKYPEELQITHDKLSYLAIQMQMVIDERNFNNHVNRLLKMEWENNEYRIICPKTKSDIIDEAQQQSNCLAGYVKPFADGISDILFMRRKDAMDTSLVTIELRKGRLRQAYQAHNIIPDNHQLEAIKEWCEEKNIFMPDAWSPMAA